MKIITQKKDYKIDVKDDKGKPTGASFIINLLTSKESTDLLSESKIITWDKDQRFEEMDYYKFKISKIERIIKDWKGFEDENGKEFSCNNENKELMYAYQPELINWVFKEVKKIEDSELVLLEQDSKN